VSDRVRPFIEVNERCAASHLTAAEMLVLPRRQQKGTPATFHVIRPEGSAHLNRPHVIVHRMKFYSDEITAVDGIPVTTPERTWLDMAEMLMADELVARGDSCVRVPRAAFEDRNMPLCSMADLQRMIHRHKGITSRTCPIGSTGSGLSMKATTTVRMDRSSGNIDRSENYQALGWTEVRISKRHMLNDAEPGVAKIRTALIQAGWRKGR
jgi:hypothetical protein